MADKARLLYQHLFTAHVIEFIDGRHFFGFPPLRIFEISHQKSKIPFLAERFQLNK